MNKCPKCGNKMVQLLISFVCDHCENSANNSCATTTHQGYFVGLKSANIKEEIEAHQRKYATVIHASKDDALDFGRSYRPSVLQIVRVSSNTPIKYYNITSISYPDNWKYYTPVLPNLPLPQLAQGVQGFVLIEEWLQA